MITSGDNILVMTVELQNHNRRVTFTAVFLILMLTLQTTQQKKCGIL